MDDIPESVWKRAEDICRFVRCPKPDHGALVQRVAKEIWKERTAKAGHLYDEISDRDQQIGNLLATSEALQAIIYSRLPSPQQQEMK